ncbi:MAG: hypothetical protein QM804_11525 [Propionicimonas sp.]
MFDEIDDLRVNLREAADGFRPSLDADGLAKAGRRVQRRNRILGGIAGVAAVALAAGFGLPAVLNPRTGIPAAPAPVGVPGPVDSPAEKTTPEPEASSFQVDMAGWLTFSSPEYPVTFQYPPDWTVDDNLYGDGKKLTKTDGCDTINCVLFINPPDPDKAAPIELIRSGFDESDSIGGGVTPSAEELVTVPDLLVWGSGDATTLTQAVVLQEPDGGGGVADYLLGASQAGTHQPTRGR